MHHILLDRAKAYFATGNTRAAAAIASIYVREVDPKDGEAQLLLSLVNQAGGNLPDAVNAAAFAVATAPRNATYRRHFEELLSQLALDRKSPPLLVRGAGKLLDRMNAASAPTFADMNPERATCVDFVLPMTTPGGSEFNAIETAKRLRRHVETRIWSPTPPHPALLERDSTIRLITADSLPDAEIIAIRGTYMEPGDWVRLVRPQRLILHFNAFWTIQLLRWLGAAAQWPGTTVDILFASRWLSNVFGIDGTFLPSSIDLEAFPARRVDNIRVIGRISRDSLNKHHPQDPALYRMLLSEGFDIRLLGATSLAPFTGTHDGLTLLPEFSVPPAEFLHSLDLFLFRTGVHFEPWGRVVIEAMACGLPVVCHRTGGYAEAIQHGENGFLFDSTDEALQIIRMLRGDAPTLRRVGEAARQTAIELQSDAANDRLIDYFTRL